MSYCVNCGVKLAPSERQCPLCDVAVINPANPWREPTSRPYPRRVERVVSRTNRRYVISLASVFLLIPVVISLITDLWLNDDAITWSAYVIGASALLFVTALLPFLFKKPRPYLWWLLDTVSVAGYIALTAYMSGDFSWYLLIGLPIAGAVALPSLLVIAVLSTNWAVLNKMASLFFLFGLFTLLLDYVIVAFTGADSEIRWSFFTATSCTVFAAAMLILERRKKLKDEIRRRLFY